MTLLEFVNRLRILLRSGDLRSDIDTGETENAMEVDLINEAIRVVLNARPWSFLARHDGQAFFPSQITATTGCTFVNGSASGLLGISAAQAQSFSSDGVRAKLVNSDDATFGETSFYVQNLNTSPVGYTLENAWRGTTATAPSTTLFSHEVACPSTVRQVIAVRNEEGRIGKFRTVSRDEFDRLVPRVGDVFAEYPALVTIGDQVVPTAQDSGSIDPGVGITIFPPPSSDLVLQYSYTRRVTSLSAATDSLEGVPDEIQDLMVWSAFHSALASNIQSDSKRANTVMRHGLMRLRDLMIADRKDIGRRRVPTPYGSRVTPRHLHVVDSLEAPS